MIDNFFIYTNDPPGLAEAGMATAERVMFSIGSTGAKMGAPSWLVWIVSILFGVVQAFSYTEIAGLFPHESGGASVDGAIAWAPDSKLLGLVALVPLVIIGVAVMVAARLIAVY